jgi:hypothetical protein
MKHNQKSKKKAEELTYLYKHSHYQYTTQKTALTTSKQLSQSAVDNAQEEYATCKQTL